MQNVDNVNESIAKILETEGPEGHPLRRAARKKARMRWKKLADVTRGAAFFRVSSDRRCCQNHSTQVVVLFSDWYFYY